MNRARDYFACLPSDPKQVLEGVQFTANSADWMMCCSLAFSCVVDELNQTVLEEVRMYLVKAVRH